MTDSTPRLHFRASWIGVPEGHFDSFVAQFKDKCDGPHVVSVEAMNAGHHQPLDSGRKYRFLVYGLLGKSAYGPPHCRGHHR